MQEGLSFGVLGPLEVRRDGNIIDLPRRKERQLLAALILEKNQIVSTDRLVESLWGDEPPTKPLASLRASVSNVRKALADASNSESVLVTDRGGYMLRISQDSIDSMVFQTRVAEATTASAEGRIADAATILEHALRAVRGEPLADLAYDEFAQREIRRLEELVVSAREQQVRAAVDLGKAGQWLSAIVELVEAYPLREHLRATHMLALYQLGRQAEALRSYQEHRRSMIDELGIDPSPDLRQLEAQILEHDPSLLPTTNQKTTSANGPDASAPETKAGTPEQPVVQVIAPAESDQSLNLVGRTVQLRLLNDAISNKPRQAFIVGDSGCGKTALANAFLTSLSESGWRIAVGHCPNDDGVPPLWPWRQILRDLDLAEAGAISNEADFNRYDYFDDLASALLDAALAVPIAVLIDDLQWADPDTIKLIVHLARRIRDEPLVLVGTARTTPEGLAGAKALWITLDQLTVEDIAELITARTGLRASTELAKDLHTRTGGNAYFATELIDFAHRFGGEVRADLEIPSHVRDLVSQRLRVLPQETRDVLDVAALELSNFSTTTIATALDQQKTEVERHLQPAIDAGVVIADRTTFGRFRFDHAITAETIADAIDPTRRIQLHQALGRAIETEAGGDAALYATELSRHYGIGAPAGTSTEAIRWARAAADSAAGTWSHREALVHLERALEASEYLETPDEIQRCNLLILVGRYSRIIADVATAEAALLDAFRIAKTLTDPSLIAEVALAMAEGLGTGHWRWYWTPGSTAIKAVQLALDALGPSDSVLRSALLAQFGADSYADMTDGERDALLADAVDMAERTEDQDNLARVLHIRRAAVGWRWTPDQALEEDKRILSLSGQPGSGIDQLVPLGSILADYLSLGDLASAKQAFSELRDEARLRGSLTWRFFCHQWQVLFAQLKGDWAQANDLSDEAMDPVTGFGEDFFDATFNQSMITKFYQGDYTVLETVLRGGAELSERPLFSRTLLNVLATSGQDVEVTKLLDTFDPGLPDADQIGGRMVLALGIEAMVAHGAEHHTKTLETLVSRVSDAAKTLTLGTPGLGGLVFFGPTRYYLSLGLIGLGRFEEAEQEIVLATEHMRRLDSQPQLIRLRFADALRLLGQGESKTARTSLEEVRAAATAAGMAGLAARVDRELGV